MAKHELERLSDDELDVAAQKLMQEKDGIRERQAAINAERSRRATDKRARELLAGMTPEQIKVVQGVAAEAQVEGSVA